MKRSPLLHRWLGMTSLAVALVATATLVAAAWLVISPPATATAQSANDASLSLAVSPLGADGETRTVALGFEQGDSPVGALEASLSYDTDKIAVSTCVVSEVGACHDNDEGTVKVVVFNLNGLKTNQQLVTVDFVAVEGATGESTFEVIVDVAGNLQATEIEAMIVDPVDFVVAVTERGSLTGGVANAEAGLYNLEVCAIHVATEATTCALTSGLGTWRMDDLAAGDYTISIVDPTGLYESASLTAAVADGEVTTGLSAILAIAEPDTSEEADDTSTDDSADTSAEDTSADDSGDDSAQAEIPATIVYADTSGEPVALPETPAIEVAYGATISGAVQDIATASPLWPLQVCAVQPLVLHQSCATTNEDGEFTIDGLSAGNYWVTAVDGLGRYDSGDATLVGVQTDTSAKAGVVIQLAKTS